MSEKRPIADAVELARRYTAEEWTEAARKAATNRTSELCEAFARFRRSAD